MNEFPDLPDVQFLDTDPQVVIDSIIGAYESIAGVTLAEGDPRRLFLLSIAYVIVNQRLQIDGAGKSNLLYYAEGEYLDHLGAFRDVERLPAKPALSTLRFTLSAPQSSPVGIPAGTRATHDDELYWRTTEPATIPAGQLSIDVPIEAMTPGDIGNGLAPGEIASLVDPIPFVASIENTTETEGGVNREEDAPYKLRIYQAPAAFSTAGPAEAYIYYSLSASPLISDVSATSPSPSVAEIRPLLQGGVIPGPDILDLVETTLSDQTIRPLADRVDVLAPDGVDYSIDFTYYIRRADQASEDVIQARVTDAVAEYVEWQRGKLGRDIIPDELVCRVLHAGAKRLAITSPTYTQIDPHEVAQEVAVNVVYGGVEDE